MPISNHRELAQILPLISFKIWKPLVMVMLMSITPRQEVHEGELSGTINLRELWKFSQEWLGILASLFSWTSPTFPLLPLPLSLSWKCCSECRLRLNPRWKLRIYFKMHSKFQGILEKGKLPWSVASGYNCDWRSCRDVSLLKMLGKSNMLSRLFWKWIVTIPAHGAETVFYFYYKDALSVKKGILITMNKRKELKGGNTNWLS